MDTLNPHRAPFLDGNWISDTTNAINVNCHLWRNGYLLLVFFLSTCMKLSYTEELTTIFYITYSRVCRGNLPQEFAVATCSGLFVFVSKSFLYVSKTFLFMRFSLLTVFLFVIALTVMGHRTYFINKSIHYEIISCIKQINNIWDHEVLSFHLQLLYKLKAKFFFSIL